MAGVTSFTSQVTSAQQMLQSTRDLFDQYSVRSGSRISADSQLTGLQQNIAVLKAKLANVKKVSDTYDREYQDRMADKPLSGFWISHGVSTLQDWILLIFFLLYAIVSLFFVVMVSTKSLFYGFMVLASSFIFGVMISATLMRFA